MFPQVQEFFFDDDTFTDDHERAEEIARGLGKLGVTWSCNARPNVPYETLKVLKENGLRLLLVGYESGVQEILNNIRKGTKIEISARFTADCHKLGIAIHGTFIVGLPGETHETIRQTIAFAKEINPHTIQVSLAAPYPGHGALPGSDRKGLAQGWRTGAGRRPADRRAQLPPFVLGRNLRNPWPNSTRPSISARRRSPRSRWKCFPAGT